MSRFFCPCRFSFSGQRRSGTLTRDQVFISHSTLDAPLVEAVVEFLRSGLGLPEDQIFASSIEDTAVPTGAAFVTHIRERLLRARLAIQIVSPAFLESQFCTWETGALWVMEEVEFFPMVVRDLDLSEIPNELIRGRKLVRLDKNGFNLLRDTVDRLVLPQASTTNRFETVRDRSIGEIERASPALSSLYRGVTRHRRHPDTLYDLHRAFHQLRDAASLYLVRPNAGTTVITPDLKREIRRPFQDRVCRSVDHLSRVFSAVTGVPCRICVKTLELPKAHSDTAATDLPLELLDLARSGEDEPRVRKDPVGGNTDFQLLFEEPENYFFSNNLIDLYNAGEYENSHWPNGVPKKPSYVSTIVWPIRKIINQWTFPEASEDLNKIVLGVLCVDSAVPDAFMAEEEGPDFQIGAAYADTLFDVIAPLYGDLLPSSATPVEGEPE